MGRQQWQRSSEKQAQKGLAQKEELRNQGSQRVAQSLGYRVFRAGRG